MIKKHIIPLLYLSILLSKIYVYTQYKYYIKNINFFHNNYNLKITVV